MQVFLSSTYTGNQALRQRIADAVEKQGFTCVLAEGSRWQPPGIELSRHGGPGGVAIADKCLELLSQPDCIIGVLSGCLGSNIHWTDDICRARHFELEILSATLQQKPTMLLSLEFSTESELGAFLQSVPQGSTIEHRSCQTPAQIVDQAGRYCEFIASGKQRHARHSADISGNLTRVLSRIRVGFS